MVGKWRSCRVLSLPCVMLTSCYAVWRLCTKIYAYTSRFTEYITSKAIRAKPFKGFVQNLGNAGCQRISGVAASEASEKNFVYTPLRALNLVLRGSGVYKVISDPSEVGVFDLK